jgi:hypothetical protein
MLDGIDALVRVGVRIRIRGGGGGGSGETGGSEEMAGAQVEAEEAEGSMRGEWGERGGQRGEG